ncbi:hypothetical protein F4860DRAFT_516595 [Xylaria cubensis]|nr:hypothetical protein F4860DRAFT_516595 [Xylaria cubensis]
MDFNLGVLTTAFTPAPNCNSYVSGLIYTQTVTTNQTTTTVQHKYHTLGLNNTSLCYPPYYHVGTGFYYSPAMCPSGWYAACGTFGSGSIPETRATCCPSGYTCMDPPPETDTWSTLSCITYAQSSIYVTVPDDSYQVWSRVVQLQPIINAGAINVRWQSTDFITTASSTSAPSLSSPSSPTKPPVATETSLPQGHGVSMSTIIAIGVVGGGGVLIILVAGIFCCLRVRRRRRKVGEVSSDTPNDKSSNDPNSMKPEALVEAWALHQAELQTANNTHEMSTASNIHEINNTSPVIYPSHNLPWRSVQTPRNWTPNELSAE